MYFNPRSHEGSDAVPAIVYSVLLHISIHAPTRGATMCYKHLHKFKEISIHAPTRGATQTRPVYYYVMLAFQSTLPRGERRVLLLLSFLSLSISIHAPTRGATTGQLRHSILSLYFNPRSHEGSDVAEDKLFMVFEFQSTLPRGERHR